MEKEDLTLITCIVQRGEADRVVDAALDAGAEGATIYYGRGRGVKERLGMAGLLIKPEKEVILIVTRHGEAELVFEAIVTAADLPSRGKGFAFLHQLDRAVGFL